MLAGVQGEWDALVETSPRPSAPSTGSWAGGTTIRGHHATLGVVLVHDAGGTLVGLGPCYFDRGTAGAVRWRPLAAHICQHVEPIALPGMEGEVARTIARALYDHGPRPQVLSFEGIPEDSPWPALLAGAWPNAGPRPLRLSVRSAIALVLDLDEGFESWFAGKRSHFRQRLRRGATGRRRRRRRLPPRRRRERGRGPRIPSCAFTSSAGPTAAGPATRCPQAWPRSCAPRGPRLVERGFLRIWSLSTSTGTTIASSLVFRAGDRHGDRLNGFDAQYARLRAVEAVDPAGG